MDNTFVLVQDAAKLSRLSNVARAAAADLMSEMTNGLPEAQKALMANLLDEGGRVGIELTVDKGGKSQVILIAAAADGTRHRVASVLSVG